MVEVSVTTSDIPFQVSKFRLLAIQVRLPILELILPSCHGVLLLLEPAKPIFRWLTAKGDGSVREPEQLFAARAPAPKMTSSSEELRQLTKERIAVHVPSYQSFAACQRPMAIALSASRRPSILYPVYGGNDFPDKRGTLTGGPEGMCLLRAEGPVCGPKGYFIDTRPSRRGPRGYH